MMSPHEALHSEAGANLPNGSGAAAVLAAGIGSFALGVFAVAGDHIAGFGRRMIFYRPTGPLSGVTLSAVVVWIVAWAILEWRWGRKPVAMGKMASIAAVLLALSLLLTFPPLANLF